MCFLSKHIFYYSKITVEQFDFQKKCDKAAAKTDGFSGRELSKLMVSCQPATFASDTGVFTSKMFDEKIELALIAHKKKMEWR
jgi:ATPase family AAA domain-containing protein 3A/B